MIALTHGRDGKLCDWHWLEMRRRQQRQGRGRENEAGEPRPAGRASRSPRSSCTGGLGVATQACVLEAEAEAGEDVPTVRLQRSSGDVGEVMGWR